MCRIAWILEIFFIYKYCRLSLFVFEIFFIGFLLCEYPIGFIKYSHWCNFFSKFSLGICLVNCPCIIFSKIGDYHMESFKSTKPKCALLHDFLKQRKLFIFFILEIITCFQTIFNWLFAQRIANVDIKRFNFLVFEIQYFDRFFA